MHSLYHLIRSSPRYSLSGKPVLCNGRRPSAPTGMTRSGCSLEGIFEIRLLLPVSTNSGSLGISSVSYCLRHRLYSVSIRQMSIRPRVQARGPSSRLAHCSRKIIGLFPAFCQGKRGLPAGRISGIILRLRYNTFSVFPDTHKLFAAYKTNYL